ncbi:hypothetical protein BKA58DRAFT_173846 [Alternaria rosae]|uniref:uncharacterized protein n=1 Tax=Alternaria rosae TaxID=1187941 RepID=UPI001E8D6DC6|nr:uncharacterized protein BKA58DRAFT_173846 [Alternaria rosae]KAH6870278.1 hypothetical protein BKA58DRAFT_173846 [Alternaria rosae]
MMSSASTENLLNSFPMFGNVRWSVLEYTGTLGETCKMNTSVSSESLKRNSTASTQDENTPPTTAGTPPTGYGLSPPVYFIDESGCQQRRKGSFLNHTPRDIEMRSSKPLDVYQPSKKFKENYSRPRTSQGFRSLSNNRIATSSRACSSSTASHTARGSTKIESRDAIELASKESSSPSSLEVYQPSARPNRRSSSVPLARVLTYEPYSTLSSECVGRNASIGSASIPISRPKDKKRQRRQTPFKVTMPTLTIAARHAPLEPLVAKHRRKASYDTMSELLPETETEQVGEMGTFGIIQRYFDSQTGGPVSVSEAICHAYSPDPRDVPLPVSPEPALPVSTREPINIYAIGEPDMHEPPPAVPDRSPKRLTNPSFPTQIEPAVSTPDDFVFVAEEKCSLSDDDKQLEGDLHVPKERISKRLDVGQAGRVGSSQVGRLAPPILSHDALTASADLGLNDLSYYLKHTGPSTDPQSSAQPRKQTKLFKVKQRKTLATRVGSVEGSPQRARRQAPIPTCAREMTTSGGARHLRIVIPTESPRNTQVIAVSTSQPPKQRRSRHIAITFNEETPNPLASPKVERIMASHGRRSFSEPAPVSPRNPKRPPESPKSVPADDHPLAVSPEPRSNREDQTRARKLRDLQRIKRKPLPTYSEQKEQHSEPVAGALPTPAHTPEPLPESVIGIDSGHDEGLEEESWISRMARMQERAMLLQRQNTELTEALAKIVGLELEDGDLKPEDVLRAFRQAKFSR